VRSSAPQPHKFFHSVTAISLSKENAALFYRYLLHRMQQLTKDEKNGKEIPMLLCQAQGGNSTFLLRSPAEIREELSAMEESVASAKEKLARLTFIREELFELVLPEEIKSLLEQELLDRITVLRDEVDEMASDVYALSEELEEALYLLFR
jgi:hypothetical protein